MKVCNSITNTTPIVVHAAGLCKDSDEWIDVFDDKQPVKNISTDVTIVSFFTGKKRMALKEQLRGSGIKVLNAGPKGNYFVNKMKIKGLLNTMGSINTKYILCLDGRDVLLSEDMNDLVSRFESTGVDVLYNAHDINWPPVCMDSEETETPFKYLNSGAFIGKKEAVEKFYQFIYEGFYDKVIDGNLLSDQIRVRAARNIYPERNKIGVDTNCEIFQVLTPNKFKFQNNILTIQ